MKLLRASREDEEEEDAASEESRPGIADGVEERGNAGAKAAGEERVDAVDGRRDEGTGNEGKSADGNEESATKNREGGVGDIDGGDKGQGV